MRLAISSPNMEDFENCIILNQIPQHTIDMDDMNLSISITVPDITCRNCTLQLMAFQEQNLGNDDCCAYHNDTMKTCGQSQYYSCANIDIVAVILVVVLGAGVAGTYYFTKQKGDAVDTTG